MAGEREMPELRKGSEVWRYFPHPKKRWSASALRSPFGIRVLLPAVRGWASNPLHQRLRAFRDKTRIRCRTGRVERVSGLRFRCKVGIPFRTDRREPGIR